MHYVLLSNYNNYYNRIYKKQNTYTQYIEATGVGYVLGIDQHYNFNLSDGVNMEHVFNCQFTGEPNYMLLLDEDDNSIVSRWFIIEWTQIRGSQYHALLRRDLLADNYDTITASPAFIEKGYVDPTDSAIFNKEDMTLNQIKTSETLLKDDTNTAWIVGYVARDHTALTSKTFTLDPEVDLTISGNFSDWAYHAWCDGNEYNTLDEYSRNNLVRFVLRANKIRSFKFNSNLHRVENSTSRDNWSVGSSGSYTQQRVLDEYEQTDWYNNIDWSTVLSNIYLDNTAYANTATMSYLRSLEGKKVQFDDGIYTFGLQTSTGGTGWKYFNSGNLYNYLHSVVSDGLDQFDGYIESTAYYPVAYFMKLTKFRVIATPLTGIAGTYTYSIPNTVRSLEDAPYKMFCIPYYTGNKYFTFSLDGSTFKTMYKDRMMAWAMSIAKELGDSLYDLQILPYCPISNWRGLVSTQRDGIWSIGKTENTDYTTLLDHQNNIVGYCSWCDVSSKEQFLSKAKYKIEVYDYKVENQCDMYRLCSPNYASVFEFNAAMNNGVEGYNIRYTYKPYQPFINVSPKFNGLYGIDFKDNRGLILAGDFSLPIVRDAWVDYQLQNKNYQLAFDRQIENLENQHSWQRAQNITGAVTGTIQGGVTGAATGGMVGGPVGAAVGAVAGTALSAAGGVMDNIMSEQLHNEAIDFAKDNFGYQLQNIKALPNTLNKVSSIVANSKLFPFVEYYTCTAEEREAFENKLRYNGMTIGRVGTIENFVHPDMQTYVKGQIIRLEGTFDTHTTNEIANEFMKGWYI